MVRSPGPEPSPRSAAQGLSPRLFLVVLGGRVPGAHIELHDVRFVVGQTLEETLPALRRQWFGRRRGLHIVNVGGYRPERLAEEHGFGLVVAVTAADAKRQALATWLPQAVERHKDDVHPLACLEAPRPRDEALDDCLPLAAVEGWHVHLRPVDTAPPPQVPDGFGYRPI